MDRLSTSFSDNAVSPPPPFRPALKRFDLADCKYRIAPSMRALERSLAPLGKNIHQWMLTDGRYTLKSKPQLETIKNRVLGEGYGDKDGECFFILTRQGPDGDDEVGSFIVFWGNNEKLEGMSTSLTYAELDRFFSHDRGHQIYTANFPPNKRCPLQELMSDPVKIFAHQTWNNLFPSDFPDYGNTDTFSLEEIMLEFPELVLGVQRDQLSYEKHVKPLVDHLNTPLTPEIISSEDLLKLYMAFYQSIGEQTDQFSSLMRDQEDRTQIDVIRRCSEECRNAEQRRHLYGDDWYEKALRSTIKDWAEDIDPGKIAYGNLIRIQARLCLLGNPDVSGPIVERIRDAAQSILTNVPACPSSYPEKSP